MAARATTPSIVSSSRAICSSSSSSSSYSPVPSPSQLKSPSRPRFSLLQQHHNGKRNYSSAADLPKTALYDLHLAHGAKMVPFGGFQMPVQYSSLSVSESHKFTRTHASLFDVSHMVQRIFSGPGAAAFLQKVTPSNLDALPVNKSTLSALLHPATGGIVDDTVITKLADDEFYVVTNAACRDKDDAYLAAQLAAFQGAEVSHEKQDQKGLVALQGPLSAEILTALLAEPDKVERRRVGLVVQGAPAREGAEVVSKEGDRVGTVTSGCPSPTLGINIAMAYVKDGFHKSGTELDVVVRGRNRKATVTKMPFAPTKYWKGTAPA